MQNKLKAMLKKNKETTVPRHRSDYGFSRYTNGEQSLSSFISFKSWFYFLTNSSYVGPR